MILYSLFHSQITIEPEMDTLYWCKILKAPVLQDKHHIIGYEALLTKERYIHSLSLYLFDTCKFIASRDWIVEACKKTTLLTLSFFLTLVKQINR